MSCPLSISCSRATPPMPTFPTRRSSDLNANTKAVAIGHVHWADGTRFDLEAIRKRTREVGALLVIDGTQSVGALPFDVQDRKSTRLNSSHVKISYAVFCLKKKTRMSGRP